MEKYYGKSKKEMTDHEIDLHNIDVFLFLAIAAKQMGVKTKQENPVTGKTENLGTESAVTTNLALRYTILSHILGMTEDEVGKMGAGTFIKKAESGPYSFKKFREDFQKQNKEMFEEA
jgi:hypothetical protein